MERRREERRRATPVHRPWKEDAPVAFPDYQQYGQAPSVAGHAAAPAGRPATLTYGYLAGVVAGLSSILGGVLLISGAHQAAEDATRSIIGGTSLDGSDLVSGLVDDAAGTLVTRGTMGLILGALVAVLALAARNGARWARIGLTVSLAALVLVNVVIVGDIVPSGAKACDVVAMLISAVAVIAIYLPSSNRYAKTRRRATA